MFEVDSLNIFLRVIWNKEAEVTGMTTMVRQCELQKKRCAPLF